MSLENWMRNGYLARHEATVAGVKKLLGLVDRELSDAAVEGLSADGRFMHAYDAGLQLCTLALHVSGYEVKKGAGHHAYTINSLEHTLGKDHSATLVYLSKCSKLRHQTIYDHAGVVDAEDAEELLETMRQLRAEVLEWLRQVHPDLIPKRYM